MLPTKKNAKGAAAVLAEFIVISSVGVVSAMAVLCPIALYAYSDKKPVREAIRRLRIPYRGALIGLVVLALLVISGQAFWNYTHQTEPKLLTRVKSLQQPIGEILANTREILRRLSVAPPQPVESIAARLERPAQSSVSQPQPTRPSGSIPRQTEDTKEPVGSVVLPEPKPTPPSPPVPTGDPTGQPVDISQGEVEANRYLPGLIADGDEMRSLLTNTDGTVEGARLAREKVAEWYFQVRNRIRDVTGDRGAAEFDQITPREGMPSPAVDVKKVYSIQEVNQLDDTLAFAKTKMKELASKIEASMVPLLPRAGCPELDPSRAKRTLLNARNSLRDRALNKRPLLDEYAAGDNEAGDELWRFISDVEFRWIADIDSVEARRFTRFRGRDKTLALRKLTSLFDYLDALVKKWETCAATL